MDFLTKHVAYNSVRFMKVKNLKLALLSYFLKGLLFCTVIYNVIHKSAYQEFDVLTGTASLKLKGAAYTGEIYPPNAHGSSSTSADFQVFDSYDLAMPPLERDSLFITTHLVRTPNQRRGICEGTIPCSSSSSPSAPSSECVRGRETMNGIQTGECGAGGGFCNIYAWCPVEKIGVSTVEIPDTSVDAGARTHTIDNPINNDDSNSNVNTVNRKVHGNDNAKSTSANTQQHQHRYISDVEKWTVFIKVDGDFALFNHSTSNAMHGLENGVNLFSIGDIARGINTTYEEIAEFGAIVQMTFVYDCDLDGGWGLFGGTSASTSNSNRNSNEKDGSTPEMGTENTHAHQGRFKREDTNIDAQRVKCQPRISYRRLDAADNQFSRGFNYRYVTKDNDVDGTGSVRTLNKAYGLRLLVGVKGKAGRSSLIKFMIAVGAGIGLLSCANFMCDFILQYLMPANDVYMESKFEEVSEDEREREILRRRNTVSRNSTDGKNDHSVDGGHRRGSSSRNGRSDVYDFPDRSSVGNQGNGDTKLNVVGSYYQSFDSKTE